MMKQNAIIRTCKTVAFTLALAVFGLAAAHADAVIKGQHATSKQPLYQVGDLNQKLTNLCRQGLFKQRRVLRLSIGYKGDKGQGITGIAQKDWNLYDPKGVAEPDRTYHFFNQGYSNCRVYVAVTPPPRRQ